MGRGKHTMVSVMYGIGVQALGGSVRAGMEEKHRNPVGMTLRAGARRILVANILKGLVLSSHDGLSILCRGSADAMGEKRDLA